MGSIFDMPEGYRHIALKEVDSTNLKALEYAKSGDVGKLWITATSQTQGKGSRGRGWVSDSGNLYTSLLLKTDITPPNLANITFVASLALYEALTKFVPFEILALKWPNDLLVNGSKVSGILLENHADNNKMSNLIIGIGVNCKSYPNDTNHKATSLLDEGYTVNPQELFQVLTPAMAKYLAIWDNGNNFSAIRKQWLKQAKGIGSKILVRMPNSEVSGIFTDIDESGRLLLQMADKTIRKISTADIFFSFSNEKSA